MRGFVSPRNFSLSFTKNTRYTFNKMSWPPTGQCVPVFQSNTRIVGNESGRDWIKQGNVYIFVMHVDCKRCWRGGDGWRWRVRHLGQINCYFFWFGSRQSRVVVGFEQILVAFILFFISAFLPPFPSSYELFSNEEDSACVWIGCRSLMYL